MRKIWSATFVALNGKLIEVAKYAAEDGSQPILVDGSNRQFDDLEYALRVGKHIAIHGAEGVVA